MNKVLEFEKKRIKGTSASGKSMQVTLSGYDQYVSSTFWIPHKMIVSQEEFPWEKNENVAMVRIIVKKWWYDKNPEQTGGWLLHEIIKRHQNKIRV